MTPETSVSRTSRSTLYTSGVRHATTLSAMTPATAATLVVATARAARLAMRLRREAGRTTRPYAATRRGVSALGERSIRTGVQRTRAFVECVTQGGGMALWFRPRHQKRNPPLVLFERSFVRQHIDPLSVRSARTLRSNAYTFVFG